MTDSIVSGSILVERGTRLPRSVEVQSEPDSNEWTAVKDSRSAFEESIDKEGWTFFFMAGEIKNTVFGFTRQKALHTALHRLIAKVKSQRCNSIEITRVVGKSFLGVPYVSVFAHPRHLQKGVCFSG